MRTHAPFRPDDLEDLDRLLEQATAVVPMADIHGGVTDPRIIGLRHDVDNQIEPAVEFANWEADRGYRATYYVLHTAPYWDDKPLLQEALEQIAGAGHEIGIHNNAIAEAYRTGRDARLILVEAIIELNSYGYDIHGTVAHGDHDCYGDDGQLRFVNDQLFAECQRPELEAPGPTSRLANFNLHYDANWLPRAGYISDSGGNWSAPWPPTFPWETGQLHMLVHPDWWAEAFEQLEVPA